MNTDKQLVKHSQHTDEEKLRAAYALNMCTVSVSQIVDYNDLYMAEAFSSANRILSAMMMERMGYVRIMETRTTQSTSSSLWMAT